MTAEPEKPAPAARHQLPGPVRRLGSSAGRALLRIMPGPIRRTLQTEAGARFSRFVPVAIAAVLASQITLAILTGMNMTAGKAALCASIVGAAVSYVLSRWAWERKGRPDLLRETVPFWLVSFAVWGFLSLVTHYAGAWAKQEHLHHLEKHLTVQGAYLAANCITFVARFLIFHYLLFSKRREPAVAIELAAGPELGAAPGLAVMPELEPESQREAAPERAAAPELAAAAAAGSSDDTGPIGASADSTAPRQPRR
jgi:putative flippase GtrA